MPNGENDVEERIDDSFLTADNINRLAKDLYCLITACSQLVQNTLHLFRQSFCRKILSTLGPVEPLEKFEMERWPGFSFGQLSWMHRADARHVSSHPDVEDIS